jgi:hypothetical protein
MRERNIDKPIRLRDFILADECFFSVVGYRNDEGIKCFLRYVPDQKGDRIKEDKRYKKLSHDEAIKSDIASRYYQDGIFRIPVSDVQEVFKPEERIYNSMRYPEVRKVVEFFEGIPLNKMGTTGSRLIDLVSEESDVDFVVYGRWWFLARDRVRAGIANGRISEPDSETWDFIYSKRKINLPFDVFLKHERRKYHRAFVGSTYFDLLYVRDYNELDRDIPEERGEKLGKVEIEAEVTDDSFVFDYPSFYPVHHPEVEAVLSYTHTFAGQVFRGERLLARGDLEVINGKNFLIVGTKREVEDEYIISIDLLEKENLTREFKQWRDDMGF